jgi:2-oxoglutarate dehydrogenase complex dehydrogenase (E1) component-like enzyme
MDDIASNVGDVAAATEIDFSLLSGANATFIAEMNRAWRDNPSSVDRHWAAYFEQLGKGG